MYVGSALAPDKCGEGRRDMGGVQRLELRLCHLEGGSWGVERTWLLGLAAFKSLPHTG